MGGLRPPHISIAKVPGWTATGALLRAILDTALDAGKGLVSDAQSWLGDADAKGFDKAMLSDVRTKICEAAGGACSNPGAECLSAEVFEELGKHAEDPDHVLPDWLRGHTPIGIEKPITPCGVFPRAADSADYSTYQYYDAEEFTN